MRETRKVLGQVAPLAITETDLYTVPASTQVVSSSIVVCHRSTGNRTFRISISVGGGATANKDYLFYDVIIAANTTYTTTLGITMGAGDIVRVYASTANFSFSIFGVEIT